jgi:DNA polymerase III alpha subunit
MINLKVKTEYSFQKAFGPLQLLINRAKELGQEALAITDVHSSWGHVQFHKLCKKAGIKPIFGMQFNVVRELDKSKSQWVMTALARNVEGLREIYRLNSLSTQQRYYVPRVTLAQVNAFSSNVVVLSGSNPPPDLKPAVLFHELSPGFGKHNIIFGTLATAVATSDVFFPSMGDRVAYELVADFVERKTTPQHLLGEQELMAAIPRLSQVAIDNTHKINDMIESFDLPLGRTVHFEGMPSIESMCRTGIKMRKLGWNDEYEQRLQRELELIKAKEFEDYFYLVADLCMWAKDHMLVGPARGSAAGSLVCYLLFITEVDPMPYGLLFERFIDITRKDLPDIDLDFPDNQRQSVIDYLAGKYGQENVAHIGTVSRLKAKSAIGEAAKKYKIPFEATKDVKDAIIERSGGDSRASFCILDTFETLEVGKAFVEKYPAMKNVARIEDHARHSGIHAAGIIVCAHDVKDCCSVVAQDNVAQIDKHDAEDLNLLKIDVLGLRTLSVLGDCMKYLGKQPRELYDVPTDDKAAYDIINNRKFSGIFQFEGYALQSLSKQMPIETFDDITALTSLARPGPLNSGGASTFIERRTNRAPVVYDHPAIEPYTRDTFGVTVFQEQVMAIVKNVGEFSWEETTVIRKAMSKSLGEEFFNQYWDKFKAGAGRNGMNEADAEKVWKNIMTFGSWAFNKSHGVSYALLSYWCMYLKAHHPLEFALACLNNEKSPEATIKLLRELVKEGFEYDPWHPKHSQIEWSIQNGRLVGGLVAIKGLGPAKAADIIKRRSEGKPLLPGHIKLLQNAVTPWDDVFECETRYGDYYRNPEKYGILSQSPVYISWIQDDGEYVFIAKLVEKNLRDMNEYALLSKRNGREIKNNNLWLNLMVEDDTDSITCTIDRYSYQKLGKPILESGKVGDYYLIKGVVKNGWRKIHIEKIRKLP